MSPAEKKLARALIFDLDGTLIDSKLDLIHSVNAMLRQMGRSELSAERISGYVGHGAALLVARALGKGTTEEEVQRGLRLFLTHYEEHKIDNTSAYPGVPETLAALDGLPMAVLTNKPVRISVQILVGLGLAKHFRLIYGGNSFQTKKPDPLGANTIINELEIPAEETLMIGDSEVDVQTARNAGMRAIAVTYGFGVHDRSAHPADVYLRNFPELLPLVQNHR
jgi:phosphoglycolate phosphatase